VPNTRTYTTNVTYVTVSNINWAGSVETKNVPFGQTTVTNYAENIIGKSIEFVPGKVRVITFSPSSGTVLPGQTAGITLLGDARSLTAGGTNSVLASTVLRFTYPSRTNDVTVTFTATNSATSVFTSPAVRAAMWGTDNPVVSSEQGASGSRTLSWPAAEDEYSRDYAIWYTTRLDGTWEKLATVKNSIRYVDDQHNDEPVVFYRVTVE